MRNIQSLDGLRAVSIALVIVGHVFNAFSARNSYEGAILGNGDLGVTVFFVISGYLITYLLLKEYGRHGSISLRNFYVRRAFRILPPYYLYLLVICIFAAIGFLPVTRIQFASAFLFLWDYFAPLGGTYPLEHLWSLSVEEQFYILWPISLIACLRRSRGSARRLALMCIAIAPLIRLLTFLIHTDLSSHINYLFHTRMDSLMSGCFVALSEGEPWFERIYNRVSRYVYPMLGVLLIVSPMLTHRFGGAYKYLLGFSIEAFCIAFSMLWLVRNPKSPLGRALNWGPVKFIGVMSYSLYLWQTVMLHPGNHTVFGRYPFNLAYIFACASFSYFLVERPSLKLREHFIKRKPVAVAC
jgi:peptidoglycan/LPS O-acetylase OafA/YrhL